MNAKQFFDLVAQMREAQKQYYKERTRVNLNTAKDLEKAVDNEINRVHFITNKANVHFSENK